MAKKTNNEFKDISEIPESQQRYLDIIYAISRKNMGGWVSNKEIADNLNVEPASVSGMLEKLAKNDLISWKPRKAIRLTDKGKKIAMQLNEIHGILRTFFKEVLKIKDEKVIEDISCEIEHHITQDVKQSLSNFLSNYLE